MRGLFVTGTDTGVGKTVLAGAILVGLRSNGTRVRALKPVITGLDDPTCERWPSDHELLARASGARADQVSAVGYGPPVSPHLAAQLAGTPIDGDRLEEYVREAAAGADCVIVEGVGGLLVPLAAGYDVRALARALGLPLVIAARPGLGTINHTLLTLEAARAAGLTVKAVVMTPWPADPDLVERSNRETIAGLGHVEVAVLPAIDRADPDLLGMAGSSLPLERWLPAAR